MHGDSPEGGLLVAERTDLPDNWDILQQHMGAEMVDIPLSREAPVEIDTAKFGEDQDLAEMAIKQAREFLSRPVIRDKFGSTPAEHVKREEARKQMGAMLKEQYGEEKAQEVNEMAGRNRLKVNSINNLNQAVDVFSGLVTQSDATRRISDIFSREVRRSDDIDPDTGEYIDPWASKSLDEKISTIKELSNAVVDFLWELEESNPPSNQ